MEEEVVYKGIKAKTETTCLFERGYWNVSQIVTHLRSVDGVSHWEEKQLLMTAFDKKIENALAKVFLSIEQYMAVRNHDLFLEIEEDIEMRKLAN